VRRENMVHPIIDTSIHETKTDEAKTGHNLCMKKEFLVFMKRMILSAQNLYSTLGGKDTNGTPVRHVYCSMYECGYQLGLMWIRNL
jgi:hypothetical protein